MTNIAPIGTNDVIGVKANTQHKFVAADFGFNDLDGNRLKEVIISTLPTGGSLMLGGVAVTANQHISAAHIGSLVWSAPTGFIGQHAFTFQVVDDSGVAGLDTDLTANILTLNVAAPVATPASLNLSALNGTNGFQINGVAANDYSGLSVASAGDINGDGFDDIIIGAKDADPHGTSSGASYVIFGKPNGFGDLNLATLDGTNGFKISGGNISDYSGRSVASAGDINGDGLADIIIGAVGADPHGFSSGSSYVVFGRTSGFGDGLGNLDLSTLDGSNGFKINGEKASDYSGRSVASAGDINGDGYGDVVIGAFGATPFGFQSGSSYVVFGKAGGFGNSMGTLDLSTLDGTNGFQINGVYHDDRSGFSVATAGDINGDGYDDLLVGAAWAASPGTPSGGTTYVIFGKPSGFSNAAGNFDLTMIDGKNGFRIGGEFTKDYSGYSVSSAGDVNGDGFMDIVIGATGADPHGTDSGATYVVFGKSTGFANANGDLLLSGLDGTNGFQISGEVAGDLCGNSVASAGDFNGDGLSDLIIGAFNAGANGSKIGASYVVFGSTSGFGDGLGNLDLSTLNGVNGFKINGEATKDYSGISVSSAGDINGDGFDDLIIGAFAADKDATTLDVGASYIIFGHATGNSAPTGTSTATLAAGVKDTTTYSITNAQLIAGFSDADGDALTATTLAANHGTFSHVGSNWNYVAEAGYTGAVNLTFTVSDGNGGTKAGANTFTLTAPATGNSAPTGAPTTVYPAGSEETTTYVITDAQLMAGFSDANGDALTAASLTADHGSFTHANGIWTYVAEKDYFGKVALSYTVTDGKSTPVTATSSFDLTDVTDVFIGKGKARDVFVGTLGHDEFKGGRGNDTLTSNGLTDTFFFGKNAGRDKILGFDAVGDDHDLINLQGLKSFIKSFADLSDNHMVQHRKDVVIDDGHGDVITLKGVHLADLDAADFMF